MKKAFSASLFNLLCASALHGQIPTTISHVVDAASFSTSLAPGSLANVVGTNFGNTTSIPVTVGGKTCAVLSATGTQLQIQIAVDAPIGPAKLQVGNSAPFDITLKQYAPVLYSADGTGQGSAQAFHSDASPVTTDSPAQAGELIFMLAIGLGPTSPMVPTGVVSPFSPLAVTTAPQQITVAGMSVPVLFSGLAPGVVGVYQINFIMPDNTTTGNLAITLSDAEVLSNTLTIPATNAPSIDQIQNNYSNIMAGLPSYGIAQGSIFVIYGRNISDTSTPLQTSYPLHTSLAGVSASVTVNGTTTHPILYYVTRTQLGAILPSNTPVGTGQITLTRNGQTSRPAFIQVVQSAFGLLTLNQSGAGPAAALDANANYLSLTNSSRPGEYVNFWGSGIGPAAGDETKPQTPADLTNIPIEVDIGGVAAKVTYHGRSIYPGLDQIQAIVPAGVQPGCNVSVVVRTGTISSNYATIPVTVSGRICSEPELGITSDQLQSVLSKPSFTLGTVNFQKSFQYGIPQPLPRDSAYAQFSRFLTPQFSPANLGFVSIGSCTVAYQGYSAGTSGGPLDAGSAINVSSPTGKATLNPSGDDDGAYVESSVPDTGFPAFIPSAGGRLSFDNGTGGGDVGAFNANLALGDPFVWTNESSFTTVNRSNGLTIAWAGGAPNSYVQISGVSAVRTGSFYVLSTLFTCAAPVAANQFTVPSAVLLALPPSGTNVMFSTLSVSNIAGQLFAAPGLDIGLANSTTNFSTTVTYQ